MKRDAMIRSGAAAIAALALSPTPAWAQDAAVDPAVTAEETPITTDAPAEQAAPPDALAPLAEPESASEPAASEASEPAPAPAARTTRAPARASTPKPAPSTVASPAAEAPAAETPAAAPPAPAVSEAMTDPVAEAKPAEQTDALAMGPIDEEVGYGLGAAALLALGIGAVAIMRRRRRVDEDEEVSVGHVEEEPAAPTHARPEPAKAVRYDHALIAPAFGSQAGVRPAFAWGNIGTAAAPQRTRETHVERAMRGPTPDNRSLSIRKRLKRAAFFDKREREMAQGRGKPVNRFAGLPKAIAAEAPAPAARTSAPQRVLEPA